MDTLIAWIMRAIPFGTIIMYGAMGEIITEKSGNLNLGVPGIMYLGGFAGFASAYIYENTTANPNMVLCVVIALVWRVHRFHARRTHLQLSDHQPARQSECYRSCADDVWHGVANFFGVYILNGRTATQSMVYKTFQTNLPLLPQLGIIGQTVFNYGFMVYAAIILAIVLHHILNHTRVGLNLRAIGENPATADAAGISVTRYKYLATCLGAGISGLGGLYYVLDYNQGIWATTTQIEALGWLAVALVIFTTWKPLNAIWGSYLFGLLYWLYQFMPTLMGISVPGYVTDLIQMVPYLVTIVVLVVTSLRKKRENQPPASLGLAYFREER